jgi:hypothetical protein
MKDLLGEALVVLGLVVVILGVVLLAVAAVKLLCNLWPRGAAGGGAGDPADWAKLVEALNKLPTWALAIICGDVQIWLGLRIQGISIFS